MRARTLADHVSTAAQCRNPASAIFSVQTRLAGGSFHAPHILSMKSAAAYNPRARRDRRMRGKALSGTAEFVSRHRTIVVIVLIVAAFAAVQGTRVNSGFKKYQWEDKLFIAQNERSIHSLADCFTRISVWPGLYRPLTTNLYYYIGRKLFGSRIEGFHIVNIAFYLANAFLLYMICLKLMAQPWAALAPIVFVTRLAHAEVVTNTVEFQSLLSVFFTLWALYFFIESRSARRNLFRGLSLASFALALLSKETVATSPAFAIAFGWLFDKRFSWRRYATSVLAAGVCIVVFLLIWKRVAGHQHTGLHFDWSFSNIIGNFTAFFLSFSDILTFKSPSPIMAPRVAQLAATAPARLAFFCVALSSIGLFLRHRSLKDKSAGLGRVIIFGLVFFLIAEAPYTVLAGRQFMRYAYFGHAGLAVSAAAAIEGIVAAIRRRAGTRASRRASS
jgi:hypothetical protein